LFWTRTQALVTAEHHDQHEKEATDDVPEQAANEEANAVNGFADCLDEEGDEDHENKDSDE
jgi:hypothetical protein